MVGGYGGKRILHSGHVPERADAAGLARWRVKVLLCLRGLMVITVVGAVVGAVVGNNSALAQSSLPPSSAPCRALLIRPESPELQKRIEGQSQDLQCTLEVARGVVDDANEAALAAARSSHANAVIMISNEGGYAVIVWHTTTSSRERRAVNVTHAEGDALAESAAFEAIALVVRSALVDLATLHTERLAAQQAAAVQAQAARDAQAKQKQQAAEAARERQDAEDAEDESERETAEDAAEDGSGDASDSGASSDPSHPDWLISGGAELAAIGADGPAVLLGARVVHALGVLRIGAAFTYGLTASLEDASTRIALQRHASVLLVGLPMHVSKRITLDGSLTAGVIALQRSTTARATGVSVTTDATAWSAAFGAELGAALWLFGPLALRVHAGVELVPGAPSYAYEDVYLDGTRTTELASPALVQPRGGLMLTLQP